MYFLTILCVILTLYFKLKQHINVKQIVFMSNTQHFQCVKK